MTFLATRALTVLAVFAHPDDEVLTAALLAQCALAGHRVVVVAATRGEAGVRRNRFVGRGEPLAIVRSWELARSCAAIGAQSPRFLDLPDGELAAISEAAGIARLGPIVSELAPDAVVTFGRDGVYAHADHLATTRFVDAVVARIPAAERPCVLHAQFPRGAFGPVRALLARVPNVAIDRAITAAALGVDVAACQLAVAVAPVRAAKLAAIEAHGSQLVGGDPRTFLHPSVIDALLEVEHYSIESITADAVPWR